jgi:hypothetical protein
MTNKEFDNIVKDKMQNLGKHQSPDWSSFSKKLTPSSPENDNFDKSVAEKLQNYKRTLKSDHWERLKQRLVKEEFVRKTLYSVKSLEVFAFILLLGYLLNSFVITFDFGKDADPSLYAHLFAKDQPKLERQAFEESKQKRQAEKANDLQAFDNTGAPTAEKRLVYDALPYISSRFSVNQQNNKSFEVENIASLSLSPVVKIEKLQPIELIEKIEEATELDKIALASNMSSISEMRKVYDPNRYNGHVTKYEVRPYVRAGMLTSNSGYDYVYNKDAHTARSANFGLGIRVGAGTEKIKITTGIEYERAAYNPQKINEIYGSIQAGYKKYSLDKITNHNVSIPIGVKANLAESKSGRTKFFAAGGVNTNVILKADYKFIEEELDRTASAIQSNTNVNFASATSRSSIEGPKLYQKNYPEGIASGFNADNFFLTANFELGFEHKIKQNKYFFMSSSYNRYLGSQGVGPNEDRHNQFSFNLGFNYKIN